MFSCITNADVIWFQDMETVSTASTTNWTHVGGELVLQSSGVCYFQPTKNCWELCHDYHPDEAGGYGGYIYRIDSTKGYQNISLHYDLNTVVGTYTIFASIILTMILIGFNHF